MDVKAGNDCCDTNVNGGTRSLPKFPVKQNQWYEFKPFLLE